MGYYAYELRKATTFINKKNFDVVLEKIKQEVRKAKWNCYAWKDNVLNAKILEDVAHEFNIKLEEEGNGYYRPVINNVYVSDLFDDLIEIVRPYMTDGQIVVDDSFHIVIIKFKNRKTEVEVD